MADLESVPPQRSHQWRPPVPPVPRSRSPEAPLPMRDASSHAECRAGQGRQRARRTRFFLSRRLSVRVLGSPLVGAKVTATPTLTLPFRSSLRFHLPVAASWKLTELGTATDLA